MGTYFPTSNDQRDASTMLYLRDPLPGSYSETPVLQGNMMMYMNFSSSASYSDALGSSEKSNTSQQEVLLNFRGEDHHHLNAWKDRNEMLLIGENSNILQSAPNLQGQGLSLSLGTNVQSQMQIQYQNDNSILTHNSLVPGEEIGRDNNMCFQNEDSYQTKQTRDNEYMLSSVSYGMPGIGRNVPNSKYLKAAQELLDEVVNVKKAIKDQNAKKEFVKDSKQINGEVGDGGASSGTPKAGGNSSSELSVAEKNELQNKTTKLLSMLEEVDRRYRQYYHQMQIVVSSFDMVAGSGASKPYTSLALQTISRHFRCLRDAINGQIHVARKSLGEEDSCLNDKGVGISRLRYVDQQLKQQRALQQLGMMQNHAWRPQRGLPETSVSILRAWLFEHFLHPYPKDSDKIMLARQTGLTRSQVSNWFINARVRLWKPMVEEMYKEEAGDADIDSNSSSETITRALKTNTKASEDKGEDLQQSETSTGRPVSDVEMMGPQPDTNLVFQNETHQTEYGIEKTREGQKQTNDMGFFTDTMLQSNFGSDRFITSTPDYQMGRFGNVSGVSLTLGLQQCEGGTLGMDDGTHGFVPIRGTDVYNTPSGFSYGD